MLGQHQQPPRLPAWPQPAAPTRFVLPDPAQASASQQIQHPALPAELKPTISYVTDSIGHNVNFEMLEKATGAKIMKAKAYCSKFGGKIPTKNFTDVVPKVLQAVHCDYLVVQASSTDLTNLQGLPDTTVNEYYRQEASMSSHQMVAAVDSALTSNPHLKGAVLMERTPRYDDLHDLNIYANSVLHQAVASSRNVNKIFVGQTYWKTWLCCQSLPLSPGCRVPLGPGPARTILWPPSYSYSGPLSTGV